MHWGLTSHAISATRFPGEEKISEPEVQNPYILSIKRPKNLTSPTLT